MKISKIILLSLIFFLQTVTVSASEYIESNDNLVSFSVRAVLPENQISDASFFEIEMETGQVQELEVVISNSSEEEINVAIETHAGATNSNGIITYDGSLDRFSEAMEYSFSDIAEAVEATVTVPAQKEVVAKIRVVAPDESFDGQILGGIQFKLSDDSEEESDDISIQQEFAYIIGVNIVEKDNDN